MVLAKIWIPRFQGSFRHYVYIFLRPCSWLITRVPTCITYVLYLLAIPTCITYLQYLLAVPTCITYLQYLLAIPNCITYLKYPLAVSTCITYLQFLTLNISMHREPKWGKPNGLQTVLSCPFLAIPLIPSKHINITRTDKYGASFSVAATATTQCDQMARFFVIFGHLGTTIKTIAQ